MVMSYLLAVALDLATVGSVDLERMYWDCDALYMKGELGGQDMSSCLSITQKFQNERFEGNFDTFMIYWNENKYLEWRRRGVANGT
jgi:hypothetical protein